MYRLALCGVAVLGLALAFATGSASARSPSQDPGTGKLLWAGTVHAKPGFINPDLNCTGNRIFFELGNGSTLGTILWEFDNTPEFASGDVALVDCVGPAAEFEVDEAVELVVYVVLRGPKTSTLNLVCDDIVDGQPTDPPTGDTGPVDDLCEIGTANLTRGNGQDIVRVHSNIAEDTFEDLLWTFDGDWRVFQIKVYELIDG